MTTSTGAVAERYAYTAYGQPTILNASGSVLTSSAVGNRYTYTGREWDETLGLHHFRARWMSPLAGRFLGRDPIGFEGSEWGLYESLETAPLNRVDPMGEESIQAKWQDDDPLALPSMPPPPLWDWSRERDRNTRTIKDRIRLPALFDCSGFFFEFGITGMRFVSKREHIPGGCSAVENNLFNVNMGLFPWYTLSLNRTCICGDCVWNHRVRLNHKFNFPVSARYKNQGRGVDCTVKYNLLVNVSVLINIGSCK
jgi:RHS repeat-associated protein